MESILEELNEGVAIVDDQLHIIFANETLTRLGQYNLKDIKGRTPDVMFPPEDMQFILRQHQSAQRYGRNRYEFCFHEKMAKRSR